MITIKDVLDITNYEFTDFRKYVFEYFGERTFIFLFTNDEYEMNVVYDITNGIVYKISTIDFNKNKGFRWIHRDYVEKYFGNSEEKLFDEFGINEVECIDLDEEGDILSKFKAIYNGEEYDDSVTLPLSFSEKELFYLMKQANRFNMTFNQYIDMIITTAVEEYRFDKKA